MIISRRSLSVSLGTLLFAPAIIRTPGLIMPLGKFRPDEFRPNYLRGTAYRNANGELFFSVPVPYRPETAHIPMWQILKANTGNE